MGLCTLWFQQRVCDITRSRQRILLLHGLLSFVVRFQTHSVLLGVVTTTVTDTIRIPVIVRRRVPPHAVKNIFELALRGQRIACERSE